ncbi:hypothetical protein KAF25_009162 [Fusarium avenaceum]|uniref:Apple domain-containing protein n=1 Tax=Fusarium avenaceum TaxID=40199 RepID=A0A9P7KMF9_9HYPO|nr:hypothetical protein KAF25_009162 [Fusarium avenaceum]
MVSFKSALLLLALGTEALAATAPNPVCNSRLGTVSVSKIPRVTSTVTQKVTVVKKVIRRINVYVIPRPRTTTVADTVQETVVETADPEVDTATETVTDEQTEIITNYHSETVTSTTTSTTTSIVTNTIVAPAGFVPVLPGDYRAKRAVAKKVAAKPQAPPLSPASGKAAVRVGTVVQYVTRVDCTKRVPSTTIKVVSTTVQGPRKTLRAKTKTSTNTSTETITSTKYPPDVTETVTETTSPTVTNTVDETSTTTITETVTVDTQVPQDFYAVCGSDHMLRTANGGLPIKYLSPSLGYVVSVSTITDAYSCCANCHQLSNCYMAAQPLNGVGGCVQYLLPGGATCPSGQATWATWYSTHESQNYVFMNGPCGRMTDGGTFN